MFKCRPLLLFNSCHKPEAETWLKQPLRHHLTSFFGMMTKMKKFHLANLKTSGKTGIIHTTLIPKMGFSIVLFLIQTKNFCYSRRKIFSKLILILRKSIWKHLFAFSSSWNKFLWINPTFLLFELCNNLVRKPQVIISFGVILIKAVNAPCMFRWQFVKNICERVLFRCGEARFCTCVLNNFY